MYPEEAKAEVRKSRLPLAEQDKAIAELTEIVNMFADRLQPILTPVEPSDKASDGERTVPVQSEVASTISDNNSRIRRAASRLGNMYERLEV